jgi:hypothetical protein
MSRAAGGAARDTGVVMRETQQRVDRAGAVTGRGNLAELVGESVARAGPRLINDSPATFQRFIGGVPQNADENCVVLQDTGSWNNNGCTATFPYACECDPLPP